MFWTRVRHVAAAVAATALATGWGAALQAQTQPTPPVVAPVAGDYYVSAEKGDDANAGTAEAPWKTIAKGVAALQPGQTLVVVDGFYNETLAVNRSGTAEKPITIKASGEKAWVSPFIEIADAELEPYAGAKDVYSIKARVQGRLVQRFFKPVLVDDPNKSRYLMEDKNGAVPLVLVKNEAELKSVEGSYLPSGERLLIHVFPHEGEKPSDTTTDLKIGTGTGIHFPASTQYAIVEGFRSIRAMRMEGKHCQARFIRVAPGPISMLGEDNVAFGCKAAHVNYRSPENDYDWYSGNQGLAFSLAGTNNKVIRCEVMHSWNLFSSGSAKNCLVDGVILHGAPNHSWMPGGADGLTIRNCVIYNAQDGLYCHATKNLVVENCTLFQGVGMQEWPKDGRYAKSDQAKGMAIFGGPMTLRNNIFFGGFGPTGLGINPESSWEETTTIENNIIITSRPDRVMGHDTKEKGKVINGHAVSVVNRMTLEAYTKAAEAAGGKGYAKLKDNVVLPPEAAATILKGGAWKRDTDEWDMHIADAASPAVDRGLKVEYVEDFEGGSRTVGAAPDIGADEFVPPKEAPAAPQP